MKLISLNIWGGRIHAPLISFLKNNQEIDIFCFQEVYRSQADREKVDEIYVNIFGDIALALPEYNAYFAASEDNRAEHVDTDFPLEYGQAIFVKKNISVVSHGHDFVHKQRGASRSELGFSAARLMQKIRLEQNGKYYNIFNLHGLHNGLGKTDSEERIAQAESVRKQLDEAQGHKILCGDFNLLPDTKSMNIMDSGLRNLIKENDITSTRSSYYKKDQRFADYMIIDLNLIVKKFAVLNEEVSDHFPLYLEFE